MLMFLQIVDAMVDELNKAMDKYYSTLEGVGYMKQEEIVILLIANFLRKYVYSNYTDIDGDKIKQIQEIFSCLLEHSCTISDLPQLYVQSQAASHEGNSIQTQNGAIVITVGEGSTVVPQSDNETQKFSDFAFQTSLGEEDFIAGYDSILNQNIRVNAGALVLNWQPII
jgi:hypothetical protein